MCVCVCAPGAIWFKFPSLERFGPPRWSEGERFGPPPGAIWSPAWSDLVPSLWLWRACPLAVAGTDGVFCWSSASEAESSPVASPVCPWALDDFNGDRWPSESNDKSPDLPGSSSSSVSALASGRSGSVRVAWIPPLEDALGHAGWQWMRCKGQTQSLQFVHCAVTARWRIVAVSSGLENPPLDNCNWRIQSDSDGAARSSPLSRQRKCVSTSLI